MRPRMWIIGHVDGSTRQMGQLEESPAAFVIEFFRAFTAEEDLPFINDKVISGEGFRCPHCGRVVRSGWFIPSEYVAYHRNCIYVIDDNVD